jgi:gamma-glutamyltranspeptidase/glutathione hydrolase
MRLVISAFVAGLTTPALAQEAVQPEKTYSVGAVESVEASDFMVAAANPIAAEAGYDVLAAGGTAADALVAVQMMLNLVEPQSSGIGGGAFLVYWDAESRKLTTLDGREKAPASATPEYWLGEDGKPIGWWDAVKGGRSVGVPGTLALLEEAHNRWGKQPWADPIQPAMRLAGEGFAVSPRLASSIKGASERGLGDFAGARDYFFDKDGTPLEAGETLRNPEFAETLNLIATQGSKVFYEGLIAEDIVAAVKTETNAGELTRDDLSGYEVIERAPVCAPYRSYDVCGMGPPSSGALTVGQMLMLLEHFDMPGLSPAAGREIEGRHLFAEAGKLAYADRALYMADSDYVRVPTRGLLDPAYMTARAQLISPDGVIEEGYAGNPPWRDAMLRAPDTDPERPGTSHIVIRDSFGNAASMTTTIETGFGSRVMVRGFLLNNELTDFSRAPADEDGRPIANRVESGKRPRSSMAPTIVMKDDVPYLLIGSPGGSRIINYVAESLVAILDWQMDPATALALPHVVNRNGATDVEVGGEAFVEGLEALGHEVNVRDLNSGLHAILIKDGKLTGAADPRREGKAMGR